MGLLRITVQEQHSFIRSIDENNILIGEDVSQHKKIHAKKDIFFLPEISPSPLTHAERLMSSSLLSKSPLPMWPKMIQLHNDNDPM